MTDPFGSVTVPRMVPKFVPCASASPAPQRSQRASKIARNVRCVFFITGSFFERWVSGNRRLAVTGRMPATRPHGRTKIPAKPVFTIGFRFLFLFLLFYKLWREYIGKRKKM